MTYTAPIKAYAFLLKHGLDIKKVLSNPHFEDTSEDLINDIFAGAARFSEDVLAPLNLVGDHTPAELTDEGVIASPGFRSAYQDYVNAGWQSLSVKSGAGGMGLPSVVNAAVTEMIAAANMALGLCPLLTASAIKAIETHASESLQTLYLGKLVSGEWTGAMDLTEPQSGSDLSKLRTKAMENDDGTYSITGQKIYITWGDHDCADNVIHLVLARLPNAPAGSKGITLFLCPKFIANPDGSLGARNAVKAIGLEHKLGIHGSPTCTMEFDGATAWRVGKVNEGLSCMFTMMNEARLGIGIQGIGIGERAYQAALAFAQEREQGIVKDPDLPNSIISHPDVRRMLLDMKARLMGGRALCFATAMASDLAAIQTDPELSNLALAREALLTPIAKSYGSDLGVDVSSIGVQVHGGMGFVEETGAAQHYRDSRIAPIYEGTNGIQAIDLVGRKVRRDGGAAINDLVQDLGNILGLAEDTLIETYPQIQTSLTSLKAALEIMQRATNHILDAPDDEALAVASLYLDLCGYVVSSAYLIKAAINGLASNDPDSANMLFLADYSASFVLPKAGAALQGIETGAGPILDYPIGQLADL